MITFVFIVWLLAVYLLVAKAANTTEETATTTTISTTTESTTGLSCVVVIVDIYAMRYLTYLLTWIRFCLTSKSVTRPGIEGVQSLADISRSALCCRSNETRAPIANPTNSAQLEGTPYNSPSYIRVCAVVWECGEPQIHRRSWRIYISPRLRLTRNVIMRDCGLKL